MAKHYAGIPLSYAVLQLASLSLLLLVFAAFRVLIPYFAPSLSEFHSSWAGVFLIVPVSFVPVLVWWFDWTTRKFGTRPKTWRILAEIAFAMDVVFCLLIRGIA